MDLFANLSPIYQASLISGLGVIVSCVINNLLSERKIRADIQSVEIKIKADRKNLEDTIESNRMSLERTLSVNSEKLQTELFAQSSKTYKELITAERIKWLNELRKDMSDFLSKAHSILLLKANHERNLGSTKVPFIIKYSDLIRDFTKSTYLIQLRLNPKEEVFLKKLNKLCE